ncbi:MAG TPA: lipopolysaccharide biosynthesis protein [Jatrophihabitans sp.]|jgi:PST family polysaccharide transporter|nr:lipopolysaccharide biosynthesis protein [Jatrophihabitans sp.]
MAEQVDLVRPDGGTELRLASRAARGIATTLVGQGGQLVLQTTSVVILARLLDPRSFGLYAMVLVVVGVGEIFRDFGLSSAAVQAKHLSAAQRDQLFWINAAIGVALMIVLFTGAPVVAALFGEPALTPIARALAPTFLINGLATQYRADLNRRMRFGRLALTDLLAQAVAVGTGVTCAALGAGYWSLVGAQLAQVSTVLAAVACFCAWLPGPPWRTADVRDLLIYGRSFIGAQLANYVGSNTDAVVAGLRFGGSPLGMYNRAFQLLMNPLNRFRVPATTVALPVLARLQDEPQRSGRYLRRAQIALGYTIVAGLALVAGASRPLVELLLGDQWAKVPPILSLLALGAAFQMVSYIGYWTFISRGLTGSLFRFTLVSTTVRVACIVAGSSWGVVGVAAGYAVGQALSWPLSLMWLGRVTVLPIGELYRGAVRILAMAGAACAAVYLTCNELSTRSSLVALGAACLVLVAVYIAGAVLTTAVRQDLRDTADVLRRVIR